MARLIGAWDYSAILLLLFSRGWQGDGYSPVRAEQV